MANNATCTIFQPALVHIISEKKKWPGILWIKCRQFSFSSDSSSPYCNVKAFCIDSDKIHEVHQKCHPPTLLREDYSTTPWENEESGILDCSHP